jgi:uncharacterized protein YacL (UPF0231 family)
MSKKAKKATKVVKKSKPVAAKSKTATKPTKKVAKAPASKAKKVVGKIAKKAVDALKSVVHKKAGKKKDDKVTKKAAKPAVMKKVAKEIEKKRSKKNSGKETPKTLQAKGVVVEETAVSLKVEVKAVKDVVLTDAEGRILCRVKDCDQPAVVEGYCRYHYLFFWKKIQNRKKILSEGKLEQYIEELTSRYPLKFLELIRKDLGSEPDFLSAIQELDIDEASTNVDDFEDENFMEEVRGIGSTDTERVDDEY